MARPDIAIVMAAGEASRWGGDTPKHLVAPEGEPILHRTVRLLQAQGIPEVWVVVREEEKNSSYHTHGAQVLKVNPAPSDADKFYSSRQLWQDADKHVLFVYGDCYFTEDAIAAMCEPVDDWVLFCRPLASQVTGKVWGECWGFSVPHWFIPTFRASLVWLAGMNALGEVWRCGGWELYRSLTRQDVNVEKMTTNYHVIDDWTEDFDYLNDYEVWLNRFQSR